MEPYYDAHRSELWLVTTGTGSTPRCVWTRAVIVTNPTRSDFKPWSCGNPNYIWTKRCTAAAQTVTFTKRIFVPGRPLVFEASMGSLGNRVRVMELLVNGSPALVATHSVHKVNLKGRANLFKYGWNVLKLTARKGASKKCGPAEYGVNAEIHAAFAADVTAEISPAVPNQTAVFIEQVTVKNKGPSSTLFGTVTFKVSTPRLKRVGGLTIILSRGPLGAPLPDCLHAADSAYCPFPGLDPGESFTYFARYIYDAPATGNFYEEFSTSWGANADTIDQKTANNGGTRMRGACRQDAPPPCKKP